MEYYINESKVSSTQINILNRDERLTGFLVVAQRVITSRLARGARYNVRQATERRLSVFRLPPFKILKGQTVCEPENAQN